MQTETRAPADCYACRLTGGEEHLPGGRIFSTSQWVVEHCTGPLGVGTLIVKPFRHCVHLWDLTPTEARELGPLLTLVSGVIRNLTETDQVYSCLWSHAGWEPGHIHFVLQPVWKHMRRHFREPGPNVQVAMLRSGRRPKLHDVEEFCERARAMLAEEAA